MITIDYKALVEIFGNRKLKILHLTLKKEWYDMVLSGQKKDEYREMSPYWVTRLQGSNFDMIHFKNGYAKSSPEMWFEWKGMSIGMGNPKWGAKPGHIYYIIKIGRKIDL